VANGGRGQVLESVGLGPRMQHFPHELSGGEQQRVAIARALATGNPILLADEPTASSTSHRHPDPASCWKPRLDAGKTVLVVTHNREISRVADRVVELSSGQIERDGPPGAARPRSTTCTGRWRRRDETGFWLRWAWRDLRQRWLQVLAIALIIALGTGMFAGLGGQETWRIASMDASYGALRMYDLRLSLTPGSFACRGRGAAAFADVARRRARRWSRAWCWTPNSRWSTASRGPGRRPDDRRRHVRHGGPWLNRIHDRRWAAPGTAGDLHRARAGGNVRASLRPRAGRAPALRRRARAGGGGIWGSRPSTSRSCRRADAALVVGESSVWPW
jgi:hypothetical protein